LAGRLARTQGVAWSLARRIFATSWEAPGRSDAIMGVMKELTRGRIRAALALAVLADAAQLGLIPLFVEGFLSPVNDGLDFIVAAAMFLLLGWHWALLPSLLAEAVPAVNLLPTWTAAVIFVTRGGPRDAVPALPTASTPSRSLPEASITATRER